MEWRLFALGTLSIISGIVYLINPNLFHLGIWKKTSIFQRF